MNLSEQDIQSFIDAWQKDFGETLTFEVAKMEACRLLDASYSIGEARETQEEQAAEPDAFRTAWKRTIANVHPHSVRE